MEDILSSHKEEIDRKAEEMREGQTGIRAAISELEEKLQLLQELNGKIAKGQKEADRVQKEVIATMARVLTIAEEQEKKSADLTLATLKRIGDLIQMGEGGISSGGGPANE